MDSSQPSKENVKRERKKKRIAAKFTGAVEETADGAAVQSGIDVATESSVSQLKTESETSNNGASATPNSVTDQSQCVRPKVFKNSTPSHSSQNALKSGTSKNNRTQNYQGKCASPRNAGQKSSPRPNTKIAVFKGFEPYLSFADVSEGLKRGELIQGPVRINPKNYEDSYIPHPDGHSDVYISGVHDRNRALNTDVVAVRIHPRSEWRLLVENFAAVDDTSLEEMRHLSLQNGASHNSVTKANEQNSSGDTKVKYKALKHLANVDKSLIVKLFPDGVTSKNLHEKMAQFPDCLLQRTGKVVYIIEHKNSRACSGYIKPMQDGNPTLALFSPVDHRLPRIVVAVDDCPKEFKQRPKDFANTLFIARITDWSEQSNFADGRVARSLGEAGQIEPETEAMLIENGVDSREFSDEAMTCLPNDLPWSIPSQEYTYRKDLRKSCIFTIDPATARDLDDALSCEVIGEGLYEIGVHIADVSFFIEEGTALDKVAADRATSVYLIQKVVPMLPRLLCEQLCSLNPDEDRLAFSVIWTLTEAGKIENEWFGRSVIRSCSKLSYNHAQGFIDEPEKEWREDELPNITNGYGISDIKTRVLNLAKVANNLRKQRFVEGALRLDQPKLCYTLDPATGLPCGCSVYEQKESNRLVEEFMLLANMATAHRIYSHYPDKAMLRRHPQPQTKQLDDLVEMCGNLGIAIDGSSAGSLQKSLSNCMGEGKYDKSKFLVLTSLCSKPMQLARYFCTGVYRDEELFRHYALNVPLYTHFTSPIRRYPDICVHRLLAATLDYCKPTPLDKMTIHQKADHCNDRKSAAKRVQESSSDMFFSVFVKECGPFEEDAMAMGVLDRSFDILVLKFGIVKRVYCDKLPLKSRSFRSDHKRPELTLVWAANEKHPEETQQTITIFTEVRCVMMADDQPLKWNAYIKHPADV